jgi:predicted transcriptional regulator
MRKAMLVSIKPKYVKEILEGRKLIELRKCIPKEVGDNDTLIIYSTHPEKAVVGICKITRVITDSPENIWEKYSASLGINKKDYFQYYANSNKAIGIELSKVQILQNKVPLKDIKSRIPNFSPPQTYKYFQLDKLYSLFKDQIKFLELV